MMMMMHRRLKTKEIHNIDVCSCATKGDCSYIAARPSSPWGLIGSDYIECNVLSGLRTVNHVEQSEEAFGCFFM